jgi:hypothetical protein
MGELVDPLVSGTSAERHPGSSPGDGTSFGMLSATLKTFPFQKTKKAFRYMMLSSSVGRAGVR